MPLKQTMLTRIIVMKVHGKKIANLILSIDELWPRNKDPKQMQTLNHIFCRSHKFVKGVFWIAIIKGFVMFVHAVWWFVEYKIWNSESNWRFIILIIIGPFSSAFNAIFCCLLATLAINVSLLFLSLQEELSANVIETQRVDLHESAMEEKLKEIIRNHQSTIKIAYKLRDVYSFAIFCELFAAAYLLGIQGFQIIKNVALFSKVAKMTGVVVIITRMFTLHWSGQLLADTSVGVAHAAYSCMWYTKSRRIKTLLHMIMIRSQTPVYLTASKFAIVKLDNFRMILSDSWSYMSIIATIAFINQ